MCGRTGVQAMNGETGKILTVHKDGAPIYDIVYCTDPACLGAMLKERGFGGRRFCVITDSNVGPLYAETVVKACESIGGGKTGLVTLPAGEENKNLDHISGIYRYLIEEKYDRKSCLIALGGGVVGDMTGYAAATYLRGISFIQVPTTLLAQADSSIGGKTGVDFEGYKNMVGAFYMPGMVFANVGYLASLDERQFTGGFAEVIKHGIIRDRAYYDELIQNRESILNRDAGTLARMLYVSNRIKKEVVEADPFEKRERMLLNFGHTIGHAVEKYLDFGMTHGECVAAGCCAAAYISVLKGFLAEGEYDTIRRDIASFGLPVKVEGIDAERVLQLTASDKKASGGRPRFVLLKSIGEAFIEENVSEDEILKGILSIAG